MKFINTNDGLINLNRVIKIVEIEDGVVGWQSRISYLEGDGETRTTDTFMRYETLREQLADTVAAAPGFSVVNVVDLEPYDIYTLPIVAWQIEGADFAQPITIGERGEEYGVLAPDGKVVTPWEDRFNSVEEFREYRIRAILLKRERGKVTPSNESSASKKIAEVAS